MWTTIARRLGLAWLKKNVRFNWVKGAAYPEDEQVAVFDDEHNTQEVLTGAYGVWLGKRHFVGVITASRFADRFPTNRWAEPAFGQPTDQP